MMSASAKSQPVDSLLRRFVTNIENFNRSFPQEKVYLHLDNTGYFMGERIWFKAYVIRDDSRQPSNLSKVLYVELVDPSGEVILSEKLQIKDGGADGYFDLDKLLFSGFYEIRAYTRYMLNWGSGAMFSRVLPILNKPKVDGDYNDRTMDEFSVRTRLPDNREQEDEGSKKMNVAFYPEGGHLVSGMENRVAFAVVDEDGAHFETRGYLESGGRKICDVATLREGRGVFSCVPSGDKLTLHLTNAKGSERSFRLPEAEPTGCVIRADALSGDAIGIDVEATAEYRQKALALVVMHNGRLLKFDPLAAGGTTLHREYPRKELGSGVSQVSLIDSRGKILASRMVFVCQEDGSRKIDIRQEGDFLKPYGRIALSVKAVPESRFSMSVRDYYSQVEGWQDDMATWLLLGSDLKGYIENSRYYVEKDDEEHRRAADLLMMVQGWQKYDLEKMGGDDLFTLTFPVERGLTVEGQISHAKKRDRQDVGGVHLWATYMRDKDDAADAPLFEDMYVTDPDGHFQFKAPDFYGERTIVMRPEIAEYKIHEFRFKFNLGYVPPARHVFKNEILPIPVDTPKVWNEWDDPDSLIPMERRTYLLDVVKVRASYKFDKERYWSNEQNAFRQSSIYYNCQKEYEELRNQGQEYVDFMKWLEKRNKFFSGSWPREELDPRKIQYAREAKYVYPRDGMDYKRRPIIWIVNNTFCCITYAPAKMSERNLMEARVGNSIPTELKWVKSVYISEEPGVWHPFLTAPSLDTFHPVTIFVYRVGGNGWEGLRKGIRSYNLQGYQRPKTYFSPNYRFKPALPDHRRTLYWNPNVQTDSKGEVRIEFYNNRDCRQLAISAEGFTKDGTPIVY